jgi:hypothetical protein
VTYSAGKIVYGERDLHKRRASVVNLGTGANGQRSRISNRRRRAPLTIKATIRTEATRALDPN